MSPADRIATIAEELRRARYPDTLMDAIVRYLAGQAPLTAVQREWQASRSANHYFTIWPLNGLLEATAEHLAEIDRRLLDLGLSLGGAEHFIGAVMREGPVAEICDYLLRQGLSETTLLAALLGHGYNLVAADRWPMAGGRYLLRYVPERLADLIQAIYQQPRGAYRLVQLLLIIDPPALDEAWQARRPRKARRSRPRRATPWFRMDCSAESPPSCCGPIPSASPTGAGRSPARATPATNRIDWRRSKRSWPTTGRGTSTWRSRRRRRRSRPAGPGTPPGCRRPG